MWLRFDASLFNDADLKKAASCFSIVQKAQFLDLHDELNAKQIASLKIKMKKGEEVVVFHQQKDIVDHYGDGESQFPIYPVCRMKASTIFVRKLPPYSKTIWIKQSTVAGF